MGLHQIEKLLHFKGNNFQTEEITYKMKENFPAVHLTGLIFKMHKEFQQLNPKRISNPVNKWAHYLDSSPKKYK
jgi:hypothetical protein